MEMLEKILQEYHLMTPIINLRSEEPNKNHHKVKNSPMKCFINQEEKIDPFSISFAKL